MKRSRQFRVVLPGEQEEGTFGTVRGRDFWGKARPLPTLKEKNKPDLAGEISAARSSRKSTRRTEGHKKRTFKNAHL